MNIFVLDKDPAVAASYHADQHLHKMILESAQMLSTAMWKWFPDSRPYIYKPAYENHPCTQWVCKSKNNAAWVAYLMQELQSIRYSIGCEEHSAMKIQKIFWDWVDTDIEGPDEFVFAGIPSIAIRNESVVQKYQRYYRFKHKQWALDSRRAMSYKGRPVPSFIADLFQ